MLHLDGHMVKDGLLRLRTRSGRIQKIYKNRIYPVMAEIAVDVDE